MLKSVFGFTESFPWWVKLSLLLLGIFKPFLGLFLIILDGFFHATLSGPELPLKSPDWIIARRLLKRDGLSQKTHLIMGVAMIISAAYVIWTLCVKKTTNNFIVFYIYKFIPVTLLIISLAVSLKALYNEKGGVAFL